MSVSLLTFSCIFTSNPPENQAVYYGATDKPTGTMHTAGYFSGRVKSFYGLF
jgi:hypothetical protein